MRATCILHLRLKRPIFLFFFLECKCSKIRSEKSYCDPKSGKCNCKIGFSGEKCQICPDGTMSNVTGCASGLANICMADNLWRHYYFFLIPFYNTFKPQQIVSVFSGFDLSEFSTSFRTLKIADISELFWSTETSQNWTGSKILVRPSSKSRVFGNFGPQNPTK